ncbi:MAG: WD40 repeat domain-containing protein, partial [Tumebacillaceae bacterium]
MYLQNRLIRLIHAENKNVLIGSDVKGRLHMFDLELNLLASSPLTSYSRPINAIVATEKYVFTRDRLGAIGKWDLETLRPLDYYDDFYLRDDTDLMEEEEPSHSPARGIAYLNGKIYANNGYLQMVVLDAETFDVLEIRTMPHEAFIDCINTERPELQAYALTSGQVYIGNLETGEFPKMVRADNASVHIIRYDKRHDRYWTSQDRGMGEGEWVSTGVTAFGVDGSDFQSYQVAYDDIEFLQFDQDYSHAYVGGFNGNIYVFDNTKRQLTLKRVLDRPLKHQIVNGVFLSEDQIYIVIQTGEVFRLNSKGEITHRADIYYNCIWTMEAHPEDESLVYAATDDGVQLIRYGTGKFKTVRLERVANHPHGFGLVKDVKVLPDGSYVAIGRMGMVFRANSEGNLIWYRPIQGITRSVGMSVDFTKCLVSTDDGIVQELNVADGSLIDQFEMGCPVYGAAYAVDGRRVLTISKGMNVHVYPADSKELLGQIPFGYRFKRLYRDKQGRLFISGDGFVELDLETYGKKGTYVEHLVNTKENGFVLTDSVHVVGYGYQMASYDYESGEILDLKEHMPDFSKALIGRVGEDGVP